jgi:hypothetical protein
VLADLRTSAPDLARFFGELGPFSEASIPALATLGDAADVGTPALQRSRPLIRDLGSFAADMGPVSKNLDDLTESLDKTGGIERAMDFIFYSALGVNGFDGVSHYLRAALITNLCSSYAIDPVSGCNANFTETRSVRGGASGKLDPTLVKLREALGRGIRLYDGQGNSVDEQLSGDKTKGGLASADEAKRQLNDPAIRKQREAALNNVRRGANRGRSPYFDQRPQSPEEQALDYLLGSEK